MKRAVIAILIIAALATGLALAGSANGQQLANGLPVFALCIIVAFAIQIVVFIPSYLARTEKFFDLTGSATFLTVLLVAYLTSNGHTLRDWLLTAMVGIWAMRLGSFLFERVMRDGHDKRFTEIKQSFPRFLVAWLLQGAWVSFSIAAALAALTATNKPALGAIGIIGVLVWLTGFVFEVVADAQKSRFRAKTENKGRFITTGLWSMSRHPNYLGEIVLWIGVAIAALPAMSGLQYVTLISPVFIAFLLIRISGIPMLEHAADERWGGQADYEAYKANTGVLVPGIGKG